MIDVTRHWWNYLYQLSTFCTDTASVYYRAEASYNATPRIDFSFSLVAPNRLHCGCEYLHLWHKLHTRKGRDVSEAWYSFCSWISRWMEKEDKIRCAASKYYYNCDATWTSSLQDITVCDEVKHQEEDGGFLYAAFLLFKAFARIFWAISKLKTQHKPTGTVLLPNCGMKQATLTKCFPLTAIDDLE